MPKTQYTVNEISERLKTSKVTIYNRIKSLNKDLKPFIKTLNNVTYIDDEGFELIKESITNMSTLNDLNYIDENSESSAFIEEINDLKTSNDSLKCDNENLNKTLNDLKLINISLDSEIQDIKLKLKDRTNDINALNALNDRLKNEVESLNKQLQDKHQYINLFQNQLGVKDKQIEELNNRLMESQKLNENNQIIIRESQQKVFMLEGKNGSKRFWNRIFKN